MSGVPRATRVGAALALAIVGAWLVFYGLRAPLGYDEAYNLQVPVHLASAGEYATTGSLYDPQPQSRLFDTWISTGPTVLGLIGGVFSATGPGVVVARVVTSSFALLALAFAFVAGRRISYFWGGWAAVASALALNTQVDWPATVVFGMGDVVGEYAAAALILAAGLVLARAPFWSGTMLGAAVLTKFLSLLAVPAFMAALLFAIVEYKHPKTGLMRLPLGFAVPLLSWGIVRWSVLGSDLLIERAHEFVHFTIFSGSGVDQSSSASAAERFATFLGIWHLPWLMAVAVTAALTGAAVSHWSRRPSSTEVTTRQLDGSTRVMIVALGGSSLTVAAWWAFAAEQAWGRHLLLGLFVGAPVCAALLVRMLIESSPCEGRVDWIRLVAACVAGLSLASAALWHAYTARSYPGGTLESQERAAQALAETGAQQFSFSGDWWQAPEIAFLSGIPATSVSDGSAPLVITPLQQTIDPESAAQARRRCGSLLYETDGYVICWPRASRFD